VCLHGIEKVRRRQAYPLPDALLHGIYSLVKKGLNMSKRIEKYPIASRRIKREMLRERFVPKKEKPESREITAVNKTSA